MCVLFVFVFSSVSSLKLRTWSSSSHCQFMENNFVSQLQQELPLMAVYLDNKFLGK